MGILYLRFILSSPAAGSRSASRNARETSRFVLGAAVPWTEVAGAPTLVIEPNKLTAPATDVAAYDRLQKQIVRCAGQKVDGSAERSEAGFIALALR